MQLTTEEARALADILLHEAECSIDNIDDADEAEDTQAEEAHLGVVRSIAQKLADEHGLAVFDGFLPFPEDRQFRLGF